MLNVTLAHATDAMHTHPEGVSTLIVFVALWAVMMIWLERGARN